MCLDPVLVSIQPIDIEADLLSQVTGFRRFGKSRKAVFDEFHSLGLDGVDDELNQVDHLIFAVSFQRVVCTMLKELFPGQRFFLISLSFLFIRLFKAVYPGRKICLRRVILCPGIPLYFRRIPSPEFISAAGRFLLFIFVRCVSGLRFFRILSDSSYVLRSGISRPPPGLRMAFRLIIILFR